MLLNDDNPRLQRIAQALLCNICVLHVCRPAPLDASIKFREPRLKTLSADEFFRDHIASISMVMQSPHEITTLLAA